MKTSTRFDQDPNAPYGKCQDCEVAPFATKALATAHMHETANTKNGGTSSHSVSVTNAERPDRIFYAVQTMADEAVSELVEEIGRLVDDGDITPDEANEAVRQAYLDLETPWGELADDAAAEWAEGDEDA